MPLGQYYPRIWLQSLPLFPHEFGPYTRAYRLLVPISWVQTAFLGRVEAITPLPKGKTKSAFFRCVRESIVYPVTFPLQRFIALNILFVY